MLRGEAPTPLTQLTRRVAINMDAHVLDEFRAIVGRGLITEPSQLHTYECDGLTNFRVMPQAVLVPTLTEEVQGIVRACDRGKIPFVARGSGAGLRGGALPAGKGTGTHPAAQELHPGG